MRRKDSSMSGASHYPISQLIARIMNDSGQSRSEFIKSLGYRSVQGGLRRLDEWLENGSGDEGCLRRIVDAYHPDPGELKKALSETEEVQRREHEEAIREIEDRERRRFKPFIWVHTVDGAHSFFTALGERKVKVLWFQEGFERLSKSEQLAIVQRRVREHFQELGGKCHGFGEILRYQFADTFDTSIVLDTSGNVIENHGGRFLLPEVWMELC
jgi:hypothetical protein